MDKFAEIVDGIVNRVILVGDADSIKDGVFDESTGAAFCNSLLGGKWLLTKDDNTIRFNYAGIGYTYDSARDAFIAPKPFASWVLDEATCGWTAPVAMPSDGRPWTWDEETLNWVAVTFP